eukprot:Hpha_TRINITY_DN581_c0_g1::TRINITY_DN581_c0_g1_i1::g.171852::m.171852
MVMDIKAEQAEGAEAPPSPRTKKAREISRLLRELRRSVKNHANPPPGLPVEDPARHAKLADEVAESFATGPQSSERLKALLSALRDCMGVEKFKEAAAAAAAPSKPAQPPVPPPPPPYPADAKGAAPSPEETRVTVTPPGPPGVWAGEGWEHPPRGLNWKQSVKRGGEKRARVGDWERGLDEGSAEFVAQGAVEGADAGTPLPVGWESWAKVNELPGLEETEAV